MTFTIDGATFPEATVNLPDGEHGWFEVNGWSFDDEDIDEAYCIQAITAWVAWWRYVKEVAND